MAQCPEKNGPTSREIVPNEKEGLYMHPNTPMVIGHTATISPLITNGIVMAPPLDSSLDFKGNCVSTNAKCANCPRLPIQSFLS